MGKKKKRQQEPTPLPPTTPKKSEKDDARRKREEELQRREEERQRELERRRLEEELRRQEEERRREEERRLQEEMKRQMEEERKRREEEEAKERKRRIEEQVRRKMEEDKRKMEERKRQAEERRRQIEEEEREKAEEEKRIQEALAQKELERRLKANETEVALGTQIPDEIDLLGGLPSEDELSAHEMEVGGRARRDSDGSSASYSTGTSQGSFQQHHRNAPANIRVTIQRGDIDREVDRVLDGLRVAVPVKKQGRQDGVYLFGGRVIKTRLEGEGGPVVLVGTQKLALKEFVFRYENVEVNRMRGMASAVVLCNFMNSKKASPTIRI